MAKKKTSKAARKGTRTASPAKAPAAEVKAPVKKAPATNAPTSAANEMEGKGPATKKAPAVEKAPAAEKAPATEKEPAAAKAPAVEKAPVAEKPAPMPAAAARVAASPVASKKVAVDPDERARAEQTSSGAGAVSLGEPMPPAPKTPSLPVSAPPPPPVESPQPRPSEPLPASARAKSPVNPSLPPPPPPPEPMPEPEPEPVEPEAPALDEPEPRQTPHVEHVPGPMYVVQLTPELAPVAKVGGLADVVNGLSRELELRGNAVDIVLPKYDCMRYDHIYGLQRCFDDLWVPWYGGSVHCTVYHGHVYGRSVHFIEPHSGDNFFNRGHMYGSHDDTLRFAFFSKAAMEYLWKSNKRPEIIHCHDWQTGLAPVFLYEHYHHVGMHHCRAVFTIHNYRHQGCHNGDLLAATQLGGHMWSHEKLKDDGNPAMLNQMKGGIVFSNFVTTVSPHHAWEAQHGQGFGLEAALNVHGGKYGGVINGIDYDVWNPEVDRFIPSHYNVDNVERKYDNKRALRERLWLNDNAMPIVAFIGRLDPQKGLDLVRHAIFHALGNRAQFVLLGSAPDPRVGHEFWQIKNHLNDNPDVHLELGFNEELAHLIYAGSDIMIVPSRYEPCGLTQLIAMKYGTVPVVRKVGGLADTVFDKDFDHRPLHERNGYVFDHYSAGGLDWAMNRAISCYYDYPDHFRHLMLNGMRHDYSWRYPGLDYLNIYEYVRE